MGSWNGTCGVSQLPIREGNKVAIFLMKKNKFNNESFGGCVHSDNFYEPVAPAIFGEYDDYGRVTNVVADKRIIDNLYGVQDDYSELGQLIDKESANKGLYFMLVHLDLYKEIVKDFGSTKRFYTKHHSLRDFLMNEMLMYLEKTKEVGRFGSHPEIERNHFKMSLQYKLQFYQDYETYGNIYKDLLVDDVVNLIVFKEAMSEARKLWMPQAGQGSQDSNFRMAKIVGKFAEQKEYEEFDL